MARLNGFRCSELDNLSVMFEGIKVCYLMSVKIKFESSKSYNIMTVLNRFHTSWRLTLCSSVLVESLCMILATLFKFLFFVFCCFNKGPSLSSTLHTL